MRFTPTIDQRLEGTAEEVRRNHETCIRELQQMPGAGVAVIASIELADGVPRRVAHGLGRAPAWVGPSAIRGAVTSGHVGEDRSSGVDRTKAVLLVANGFGATITVDLLMVL